MRCNRFLSFVLLSGVCMSCVKVNTELGRDFIATDQQYDIYTVEFPIDTIRMEFVDSLSGYSSTRITIGAIRDDRYGLTTRGAAFSLVPLLDTLDFGQDPVFRRFHFAAACDTVSVASESERYILQNVNVYELERALDGQVSGTNSVIPHRSERISEGIPVLNGADSLSFDFTRAFGEKYMQILQEDLDSIRHYTAKYPGIYLSVDAPRGRGGRINLFELSCLSIYSNTYYLNNNLAELFFTGTYNGVRKDTSFLFIFGEADFYDENEYVNEGSRIPQYSLNVTGHESSRMQGVAVSDVYIEGGGGLKPVLSATELRRKLRDSIRVHQGDSDQVVINKASLILPYELPGDYRELAYFPDILSPTCRIATDSSVRFAGLTDASNSSENQGGIDRSNMQYAPDITHHIQELLRLRDEERIHNYDIWFLIVKEETTQTAAGSSYMNDYYQNLLYASYYNNMYGYGGYSSYGYGGYGYNSYSNYYSYMLMAQAYASSSGTTSTSSELDLSRFYKARLNGPREPSRNGQKPRIPRVRVTYSVPKAPGAEGE